MKDIEKDRQHERERAWNRPLSARSRTSSHTGSAGHPPSSRRGSDQARSTSSSAPHSREDSRAPSPNESVRSRATEEGEENHERERNWGSSRPRWTSIIHRVHQFLDRLFFAPADAKHSLKWFRQAPPAYSQPILTAF